MIKKPKTITTLALFFDGEKIDEFLQVIQLLMIKKSNNLEFDYLPLTDENIFKYLFKTAKQVQDILSLFSEKRLSEVKKEWIKQHKTQKLSTPLEQFLIKKYRAYYQEYLKWLYLCFDEIPIYHKVINPQTGNRTLSKCYFSKEIPKLSIELTETTEGNYELLCHISIVNLTFPADHFVRSSFLLRDERLFYLLSLEDFQTLDFLEQELTEEIKSNKVLLYSKIVKKLQKSYEIKHLDLLQFEVLETAPKNCLLLSEINSGSFLMLTPQWRYDHHLLEGNFEEFTEVNHNGNISKIKRNKTVEQDFVDLLRSKNDLFKTQINGYFFLTYEDAKKKNWFLKFYHEMLSQDVEIRGMDLLHHFRYSSYSIETNITQIRTIDKIVSIDMTISFGPEKINLRDIQKTVLTEQRHLLLEDGSIGVLSEEWWDRYALFFKHGSLQSGALTIPKWLLISAEQTVQTNQLKFVIEKEWWEKWRKWQEAAQEVYSIPCSVKATLRPYQQKGYEWLRLMAEIGAGACLADDMGLGKTLQTISFIAAQLDMMPAEKMLIVCPGSLIYNWKNEMEKFLPEATIYIHQGTKRNFNEFKLSDAAICVTSYATLRNDIEDVKNIIWNTIILDESHNIKNYAALTTKAIYQVFAKHKIALSGTPIMNNTFDLYAQLNYLLPNFLGSQEFFRQEYANPIDKDQNVLKAKALSKLTNPFILRRTKKQVATDLPEKTESILWCEMNPAQEEIYTQVKQEIADSVFLNIKNEGLAKSKLTILQGILRLRQVCCSPLLLKDAPYQQSESIKIDLLMEELKNNLAKNKVLIFSQFKQMLHLIADELKKSNIKFYHFDGDTDIKERMERIDAFQSETDDTSVLLMTIKTGNAGINLTAADYVFLVDPWWNNAIEQQAIDRTYRIGQTKNVFAYKMICKNTIEEYILDIKSKKSFVSDNLIEAEEGFVKNLTLEDIEYLFK